MPVGLMNVDAAAQTVTNTTTETEVFEYVLPANSLCPGRVLRVGLRGTIQQGTGGRSDFQFGIKCF